MPVIGGPWRLQPRVTTLTNTNLFLNSLSPAARDLIFAASGMFDLMPGAVLQEPAEEISQVYFPLEGAACVFHEAHEQAPARSVLIGRDGALGASAAIGNRRSFSRTTVVTAGRAIRTSAAHLRQKSRENREINTAMARHELAVLGRGQMGASCNGSHALGRRLASWISQAGDCGGVISGLTPELLSCTLEASGQSVRQATEELVQTGLVALDGRSFTIRDTTGLSEACCECRHALIANHPYVPLPLSSNV